MVNIGNDWDVLLKEEFQKEYYQKLRNFLAYEYKHQTIYPDMYDLFNALKYCSYQDVKCVILGQDPYHGENQAHGLSFSVKKGVPLPPSLQNIFLELHQDIGCAIPSNGELTKWAKQGVLLLNSVLSVRKGCPNSHSKQGWETLTDRIIALLDQKQTPVVFLLWGKQAQAKKHLIQNPRHICLCSSHPSPFSASYSFFGSRPFSKTNAYLSKHQITPIDWNLIDQETTS